MVPDKATPIGFRDPKKLVECDDKQGDVIWRVRLYDGRLVSPEVVGSDPEACCGIGIRGDGAEVEAKDRLSHFPGDANGLGCRVDSGDDLGHAYD